jgi:DNA-directed RNA polymerase subunit M/transcription elongation factor TFIIS
LHFASKLRPLLLGKLRANGWEDHFLFQLQMRVKHLRQRAGDGTHLGTGVGQRGWIIANQAQYRQQALQQIVDRHVLVVHRGQSVMHPLVGNLVEAGTQAVLFVGLVQRKRNRVVAIDCLGGTLNFLRRRGLRVRQLRGNAGEMTNALMAADKQLDRIVLGFSFRGGRNLVQHLISLSQANRRLGCARAWPLDYDCSLTMSDIDIGKQWRALEETYGQMGEEELRDLAGKAYDLTDVAKQALQAQILSRGLQIELREHPADAPDSHEAEPAGDFDPGELSLVSVTLVWDAERARRVMSALHAAGFAAYLGRDNLENVGEFHSSFDTGVEVRVRDVDQQRALHALSLLPSEKQDGAAEEEQEYVARCPKCHSDEIVFEELVAAASATGSPTSNKFRWRCDACGNEWEDDGVEEPNLE